MDSTGDAAPADELRELTRQLRTQLRRHVALGAWAAPGGPTAAYAGTYAAAAEGDAAPAEVEGVATDDAAGALVDGGAAARGAVAHVGGAAARGAVVDGGAPGGAPTDAGAVPGGAPADAGGASVEVAAAFDDPRESFAAAFAAAIDDPREAFAAVFDDPREAPAAPAPRAAPAAPAPREAMAVAEPAEPLAPLGRRTLAQIREDLGECTRCKLHTTRRKIVFGVGAEETPLMFVGEAPGEQEDRRGEPFVGPAGELLDRMIEAMGWTRDTVYIANTTKCRPPQNRNPQPDELAQCTPFLDAQIRAIAPRIIVTLGRPAANHVLGRDAPISALRGKFHDRGGVKVMPTFHPAYLLREPDRKKDTWSDLKQVIAELERLGIQPPRPPRA